MSHPRRLTIATRASRLALWQAEHVRGRLLALYPDCSVELLTLTTKGDQILDRALSKVGGKGLFVKELETALLDGRADLAVHSLKDVPIELDPSFDLCSILARADPRDAFVSNRYAGLADLPAGAVVGTSSLRRESQIRARYPGLQVRPLRGNLDTRLAKLDRGDYDAIVLAAAGLERLGLTSRIRARLDVADSLPAAGQGALGIEILAARADLRAWLAPLASAETTACAVAERAVSRIVGGSCQIPIGAYATVEGETLRLRALIASVDGQRFARSDVSGPVAQAAEIGATAARELLDGGAAEIMADLASS
ncbi:hydroxymethylbilane synthase [Bordetella genomosp. 9]|uniref:hydroxymethylbilane synthase n=1 Tax=Bordetella genomosp. 9 TaxID=1416803 RepID=UPI000A28D8B5|nr:hydroxymethylbilane synthase [Bordetella genomosp. 9]ARP91124.1 hydroxymethylbilane synthase [Bordetella genomosp. 9]